MKEWSDKSLLKTFPNPIKRKYKITHIAPELTFLGVKNQPDFARIAVTMIPKNTIMDLKSFKFYLKQFRQCVMSYERIINVIYDDLMEVFDPISLKIEMETNPRGGISSLLEISSDELTSQNL